METGKDVMELLPYLSAYMGHSELTSTLYYIRIHQIQQDEAERIREKFPPLYGWMLFEHPILLIIRPEPVKKGIRFRSPLCFLPACSLL